VEYLSVFPFFNTFPALSTWKEELPAAIIGVVATVSGRCSRNAGPDDGILW